MKNYLGVDWGKSKIGLARGNEETKLASPFKTIKYISELLKIIQEEEIGVLVIGSPLTLSGDISNDDFTNFLKIIEEKTKDWGLEIHLIDERFTSVYAQSLINRKIKQKEDALAAMLILQSYFDKKDN